MVYYVKELNEYFEKHISFWALIKIHLKILKVKLD